MRRIHVKRGWLYKAPYEAAERRLGAVGEQSFMALQAHLMPDPPIGAWVQGREDSLRYIYTINLTYQSDLDRPTRPGEIVVSIPEPRTH